MGRPVGGRDLKACSSAWSLEGCWFIFWIVFGGKNLACSSGMKVRSWLYFSVRFARLAFS